MSDNSNDCISNYYKQEYKPATSSDERIKELEKVIKDALEAIEEGEPVREYELKAALEKAQ